MKIRRFWWLMGFSVVSMLPAFAQENRSPDRTSLSRTPLFAAEKRDHTQAAFETSFPAGGPHPRFLLRVPAFTRVEREKTPFSAQTRLPVADFWGGRVQLACVRQRYNYRAMHAANQQSTRYQMSGLEAPGLARGRSRTNYGVTLSFHFGRRTVGKAVTPPAQER